jgi:hypothetical protein
MALIGGGYPVDAGCMEGFYQLSDDQPATPDSSVRTSLAMVHALARRDMFAFRTLLESASAEEIRMSVTGLASWCAELLVDAAGSRQRALSMLQTELVKRASD